MKKIYEVNGKDVEVEIQTGTYDEVMAKEVLSQDYYELYKHLRANDRVLDLGGEVGLFTVMCVELGAKEVVAFEPLAQHIGVFKRNTKGYGSKVTLVEKAITGDGRKVYMNLKASEVIEDGKTYIHTGDTDIYGKGGEAVKSMTYESIVEKYGEFDIVKLDIEGAEMEVFKSIESNMLLPRVFTMEYHGNSGEQTEKNGEFIKELLSGWGYMVELSWAKGTTQGRIVAYKA